MVPGAEARGLVAPRMANNDFSVWSSMVIANGELTAAGLDDLTALPDHGDDGAAQHV